MLQLRYQTPADWVEIVRRNLIPFLQDHAANERKVSASAMTLAVQHPTRHTLVDALIDIAGEELAHFRQVYALLRERSATLAHDAPDPYMSTLRRSIRKADVDTYLLDRLVLFAVIEARGCERFALLAEGLDPPDLARFYRGLVRSEARHHALYLQLARAYFAADRVDARLDELLAVEAAVARNVPLRPALH